MSSFCWQVAELSAYLEEMDVSSDIWMCYTHCLCPVQGQVLWKKPRQLLCPAWLRKCGHRTTRSEQDTGVCREKRGLTNVTCKGKRPWLPVSVMLSGLSHKIILGQLVLLRKPKAFLSHGHKPCPQPALTFAYTLNCHLWGQLYPDTQTVLPILEYLLHFKEILKLFFVPECCIPKGGRGHNSVLILGNSS